MIPSSRPVMLGLFIVFSLGEVIATSSTALAKFLVFFSPLEWISSLVFVMTGQLSIVEGLLRTVTFSGNGAVSIAVRALISGLFGTLLCITVELVLGHAKRASMLGGKLFHATFIPIWLMLITYKAWFQTSSAFNQFASGLENLAYEVRLSTGFGLLLFAVVIPMLALLCTQALEVILRPERSYSREAD
jgi:hypothetical protein